MSSLPTDSELNALLDDIPVLAGQPRQLLELLGGPTNRNVKITTPDAAFVARWTDTTRNFLGIDRDNEYTTPRPPSRPALRTGYRYRPKSEFCCWAISAERRCAMTIFSAPGSCQR